MDEHGGGYSEERYHTDQRLGRDLRENPSR